MIPRWNSDIMAVVGIGACCFGLGVIVGMLLLLFLTYALGTV